MANELKITFTGGALLGEERTISLADPVLIGRSHSAGIRLKEADVSGRHVELRMEGDRPCAVCLSRHGFVLNSQKVSEGESRPIGRGDVLSLGTKVRFRIDEVLSGGGVASRVADADSVTFETRAMTMMADATMSTRPAPESMTFETRMASGTLPSGMDASLQGSMEEFPVTDSDSVPAAPRPPVDDSPTADDPLPAIELPPPVNELPPANDLPPVAKSPDTTTDFNVPPDDVPTGVSNGTDDGETMEMKTRQASMDEIFRMKRMLEAKKKFRRKLVFSSVLLFMSVLGTIVLVSWPRDDKFLSHPRKAGTDAPDFVAYEVKSKAGSLDMTVNYPRSEQMKVFTSDAGIDVSTFTGLKRNVPFRLSFARKSHSRQLHLSLADAVKEELAVLEKKGYVFFRATDDDAVIRDESNGLFFFEELHKGWCQVHPQRGTLFFRKEFIRADGGQKWHGIVMIFRNGRTIYSLIREIPEVYWSRGRYLLRDTPNISLYAGFLRRHWESPGDGALLKEANVDDLFMEAQKLIDRGWVEDWSKISACINTLVVMTFDGAEDVRKRAFSILNTFWSIKDRTYRAYESQYKIACKMNDKRAKNEAFRKCKGAFGDDVYDLRSRKINDPKEWSCQ